MNNKEHKENSLFIFIKAVIFGAGLFFLIGMALCFGGLALSETLNRHQQNSDRKALMDKVISGQATNEEKWEFIDEIEYHRFQSLISSPSERQTMREKYLDELVADNYPIALVTKSQSMLDINLLADTQKDAMLTSLNYLQTAIQLNCKTDYRSSNKRRSRKHFSGYLLDNVDVTDSLMTKHTTAEMRREYGLLTIYHFTQCDTGKSARAFVIDKLATRDASLFSKAQSYVIAERNGNKKLMEVIEVFVKDKDKVKFERKVNWLKKNFRKRFLINEKQNQIKPE